MVAQLWEAAHGCNLVNSSQRTEIKLSWMFFMGPVTYPAAVICDPRMHLLSSLQQNSTLRRLPTQTKPKRKIVRVLISKEVLI